MNGRFASVGRSLLDPRIFATVTLVVIQLSLLVSIGLAGGGFSAADEHALERYGALVRALVWDDGQYWRLATALFLHGGPFHFLINAVCLLFFGGRVEAALGHWRFVALYFAAGLTGNLASLLWGGSLGMSIGSSGAIFGVAVAYLIVELRSGIQWTRLMRRPDLRLLCFLIGFQLAMGFLMPAIDSMAHLGGALTGGALGLFFAAPGRTEGPTAAWRWLPAVAWLGVFGAMAVLAARPPSSPEHHVRLGFYYLLTNRPDRVVAHFDRAASDGPGRAVVEADRLVRRYVPRRLRSQIAAMTFRLLGAEVEAVRYYRSKPADDLTAEDLRLIAALCQSFSVADSEGALQACAEGRERFPDQWRWDLTEARVLATFRRFDDALEVLDRLSATSAAVAADYWEIVALCNIRRHRWREAEEATSRCLSAPWLDFPMTENPFKELVVKDWRLRALAELGRKAEADALAAELEQGWRRFVVQHPNDSVALNNLAWFLATHGGDLEQAAQLARRSVELAPDAANLDTLAWIEHLRGDDEAAWATIERALAHRQSNSPEFYYHAGAILHGLGRDSEARRYLRRAIGPGVDFEEFEEAAALLRSAEPSASAPSQGKGER